MKWYIGCSGFHYKDWKDVFYPKGLPQRKWFEFYCSRFDTLELNVTFYRFPQLKMLENWYDNSPPHFVFAAKAPRLITHFKRFRDCDALLSDFYRTTVDGLGSKLGAVLFQLPATIGYEPELLDGIVKSLSRNVTNVIEFRHPSWWTDEVFRKLKRARVVFSGISHPQLPDNAVINGSTVYYRFHGAPRLYYSSYASRYLKSVVEPYLQDGKLKKAFIFFNNTATPAAIKNAECLKKFTRNQK